jgi:long-subunit fatty acid transport protein
MAGTHGFAFMKLPYSARAMGMANAFTGLANDGDAVFFNTAGLSHVKTTHLKINYMNYIEGLHGGSAVYNTRITEDWIFASFMQFLVSDDITRTDEVGREMGTFNTSNIVAGVGFARTMHPSLDFGVNFKYIYESLDPDNSNNASAIAVDLSVLHQTNNENLKVGVSLRNFGTQLTYYTDAKYEENLPTMLTVGLSYRFQDKGFLNFDLCRPFDNDFFFRFGLEYYYNSMFTIRGGVDSRMNDYRTDETLDFMSGIALGAGFNFGRYVIDYGISSMGSLGFVNQISVTYNF